MAISEKSLKYVRREQLPAGSISKAFIDRLLPRRFIGSTIITPESVDSWRSSSMAKAKSTEATFARNLQAKCTGGE
jgi:hypothetical protein